MLNLVLGFVAAFLCAALPGKAVIAKLQRMGAKQNVSADAPTAHGKKQGTPTMGGVLILFALVAVALPYFVFTQVGTHRHPVQDYTLVPLLLMTLAFGAIGFADDYLSLKRGKNLGLRAREKFVAAVSRRGRLPVLDGPQRAAGLYHTDTTSAAAGRKRPRVGSGHV